VLGQEAFAEAAVEIGVLRKPAGWADLSPEVDNGRGFGRTGSVCTNSYGRERDELCRAIDKGPAR
jgi:hypothetical protein